MVCWIQGYKGRSLLSEPAEVHAHVRGHLMRALNANTVAASIWQLSDTVQDSIAAIMQFAADGPAADEEPRRPPGVDASAMPTWRCHMDPVHRPTLLRLTLASGSSCFDRYR